MTFYQELQLSSTGSKQLIKNTTDPKEKRRHILIYNFKVYLVMIFCVAVVSLYSKFIGNDNSVVGVTVLLAVLVLRGRLWNPHITWIALYCRNICYSDDGTTFCKHTVTSTCICSKCDCNSSSDDSWMPQCDHVQSFHFCTGVFTSAWL